MGKTSKKSAKRPDDQEQGLRRRLDTLDERLDRRRADDQQGQEKTKSAGYANALRLSSEFVAAVLVGAGLGYLIDRGFGSSPWAMIVMLLFGFAAGVVNVMRAAGKMADPEARLAGQRTNGQGGRGQAQTGFDDDDEDDY